MNNKNINILCATDENYAPYYGVMLTSLFENNKGETVNVYVIVNKVFNKRLLRQYHKLEDKYGQKISFIYINDEFLKRYPIKTGGYWTIVTYYRMYVAELLPETIDKILYLDCDMIVTANLSRIWDIDLSGKAIAAISNIHMYSDDYQRRLGYPPEASYFNGGTLLINVDYWRKNQIGQQCRTYLENNYNKIVLYDQDILNAVLWDKKIHIPLTYNFQIRFLLKEIFSRQSQETKNEIIDTIHNPCIIHYALNIKPWSAIYYKMPYSEKWKYYKRLSPWAHMPETFPRRKFINWFIKRYIMWPVGLMKYGPDFIDVCATNN